MSPDLDELERKSLAYLAQQAGDAAHDLAHIRRVVANARRLAASEGGSLPVIVAAAWLHDCVIVPKDSPQRKQASRLAAVTATELLKSWGWLDELLPAVSHAIEAHSFSAGIPPTSTEAKIVQDADRLDAIGATGLARCLMLSGEMRRPLYVENDPFCDERAPDDALAAVDHFYTKLLKLEQTMQTNAGRNEARQRTEFLRAFLDQLRAEIG